ncbi:hypothetical protein J6H26_001075 [Salmonella enterica subsp. enterica serovar Newport]|nr:hypothetical protein [Salmonella enterica subsp. enterica serovar Newport]EHG9218317.1 hypothetical protein [Salmonella enterica subsp. enterica serovar Newport]
MTVIKGTITDATGQPLAGATITFTALQNTVGMLRSVATYITTVRGEYEFTVTPGVYSVSLAQNGTNGYALGTIHIYDDSPDGTLNSFLNAKNTDTRPEALRQYELLSQQAAGAAATSDAQAKTAAATAAEQYATEVRDSAGKVADAEKRIAGYADTATQNAGAAMRAAAQADESRSGAQQALEEARQIAKTPGPSAYDVWVSQQPAGSDTSMQAWLSYQKGKDGRDGRDGKDGVQPGDVASYMYHGWLKTEDLNDLTAEGVWVQPEYHAATTDRHYPVLSSLGPPHGDRGRVRVSRINPLYIMQTYTSVSGVVATRMGLAGGPGYMWYDWKIVNQATPKPGDVRAYILAYLNPADMTDDYRHTGRINGGVLYSLHVSSMSTLTLRAERDRRWTGAEWVTPPLVRRHPVAGCKIDGYLAVYGGPGRQYRGFRSFRADKVRSAE